jgi:hypothetical protein
VPHGRMLGPVENPPPGVETTPPVEAVVVDPGPKTVDLGPLSPSEREALESELDAQSTPVPSGAPQAGYGGASSSPGPSEAWLTAGGILLLLGGGATFTVWRRRRSA